MKGTPASKATSASVKYVVSARVADAVRFYQNELTKNGWRQELSREFDAKDRAVVRFSKELFILEVEVMTTEGGRGVGIAVHNRGDIDTRKLLHPEDAEFDSAASFPEDARYTTAATVDNVIDFYRNELPKFGWQLAKGPEVIPSHIELEFVQKAMKLVLRIANNAKKKKVDVHIQSWVVGEPAASVDKSKSSGSQPQTRGDRPTPAAAATHLRVAFPGPHAEAKNVRPVKDSNPCYKPHGFIGVRHRLCLFPAPSSHS